MHYFIFLVFLFLAACDSRPQNIALGTLERDRIAHTATANEVVVALPITQGSEVKKGTLLVKLDDTLQKAQVRYAEAEVAAARVKVAEAKAVLVESEANYERSLNLVKQEVISEAALDKALASRDARLVNLSNKTMNT